MSGRRHSGFQWLAGIVAIGLLAGIAAQAAPAPPCGALCGQWRLDAAGGDDVKALLDAALATYEEPRPKNLRNREPRTLEGAVKADMERSIGPITDRPGKAQLREDLERLLQIPERLTIQAQGTEFLIGSGAQSPRRLSPGEPHARVDAEGTATIRCNFKGGRLTVTERYDRRREYTETYATQRADGSLLVSREVRRPGIRPIRIRTLYRPA